MDWLKKYKETKQDAGGGKLNQTNNIPEVTVYGKNQYLQELDKQQQKYLADMAKYKQDSAQWVKANQAYQDSLGLYDRTQKYIKEMSDYYDTTPEEIIREYSSTYDISPTSDKRDIDLFMKPNRYVNDWLSTLRNEAIRTSNRPTHVFPPGEYIFTNFPLFKKPVVDPQKPIKTTTAKNVKYDSTYEHLNMRSLWPEMVKQDTTTKIGTLHLLDPLFNKGFTYGEAQKFPEEIKKKYKLNYPIKFQSGGQITAKDRLKQHYKNQANKGKQAVTSGTNKFAKNYMLPAAKIAGSVTPIGPVIGLMDAKEAYDSGNTGWAMFGAGMEALPYAGKYISKGVRALPKVSSIDEIHKLNPLAFKPKENMLYRGIGEAGMKDALSSGVFRAAAQPVSQLNKTGIDLTKSFSKTYYTPNFEIAQSYANDFIAEVPNNITKFRNRYPNKTWSQVSDINIPIQQGRILKKNWLWEYKPIKTN